MSMIRSFTACADRPDQPFCWFTILARYTSKRRDALGLSLERAAELAGLETSEWAALESGWWAPDPDNFPLIRSIAATLEISWMDYTVLVTMASWQQHCPEESAGEA